MLPNGKGHCVKRNKVEKKKKKSRAQESAYSLAEDIRRSRDVTTLEPQADYTMYRLYKADLESRKLKSKEY